MTRVSRVPTQRPSCRKAGTAPLSGWSRPRRVTGGMVMKHYPGSRPSATTKSVAEDIGVTHETLRDWIRLDDTQRTGPVVTCCSPSVHPVDEVDGRSTKAGSGARLLDHLAGGREPVAGVEEARQRRVADLVDELRVGRHAGVGVGPEDEPGRPLPLCRHRGEELGSGPRELTPPHDLGTGSGPSGHGGRHRQRTADVGADRPTRTHPRSAEPGWTSPVVGRVGERAATGTGCPRDRRYGCWHSSEPQPVLSGGRLFREVFVDAAAGSRSSDLALFSRVDSAVSDRGWPFSWGRFTIQAVYRLPDFVPSVGSGGLSAAVECSVDLGRGSGVGAPPGRGWRSASARCPVRDGGATVVAAGGSINR
ncbi:hypothetical protein FHX81_2283 [Saccharothrix saharensis]|uniref:Transposase n=1 Tax=Saccharothrix saharensis TaxID=571190 RepID=A0A543JAX7_9PSEU|nr:hypothetical protein FHX81_2283 [Saccharothrix saharensis]